MHTNSTERVIGSSAFITLDPDLLSLGCLAPPITLQSSKFMCLSCAAAEMEDCVKVASRPGGDIVYMDLEED